MISHGKAQLAVRDGEKKKLMKRKELAGRDSDSAEF